MGWNNLSAVHYRATLAAALELHVGYIIYYIMSTYASVDNTSNTCACIRG